MKRYFAFLLAAVALMPVTLSAQNNDGYYKDVYMDGGMSLSSRRDLPATRALGLSLEVLNGVPYIIGVTY